MTATLNITTEITEFARRVREYLGDLPAEEVDDLTDGLEADLAEAFSESPSAGLPDPRAYALELRNAAGLPESVESRGGARRAFGGVATGLREQRAEFAANLRKNPTTARVLDFFVELRPAWWILRAWVAFQMAEASFGREGSVLPYDFLGWIVLVVFVVVSVQWGRKSWMPFGFLTGLVTVGNVIAVLLLIPAMAASRASAHPGDDVGFEQAYGPSGTAIDGEQVSNIFAYDAEGNPLSGVQLFDQTGRLLVVGEDTRGPECDVDCMTDLVKIPSLLEDGRPAWNVFPLKEMAEEDTAYDEATNRYVPNEGKDLREPTAPFLKVPGLLPPKAEEKATEKVEKGND